MRKRNVIPAILGAVLLLFATPAFAKEAAPFTAGDLNVNAAYAGMLSEDVRALFGAPASTETLDVPATGETQLVWTFDGLTLTFVTDELISAQWTNPALTGPRGLRVGDSAETVLDAFYRDPAQTDADVLYTAGWVAQQGMQLPPCGTVTHNEDGTLYVRYLSPMDPYSKDVLDDPINFVYQRHASLLFTIDADGYVSNILWDVAPLAE